MRLLTALCTPPPTVRTFAMLATSCSGTSAWFFMPISTAVSTRNSSLVMCRIKLRSSRPMVAAGVRCRGRRGGKGPALRVAAVAEPAASSRPSRKTGGAEV